MHVPVAMMLLLFSPLLFSQTNDERLSLLKNLNRIAFGSCNNQGDEQPLWKDLIKQKPDLWIWGGRQHLRRLDPTDHARSLSNPERSP